jgi:hypothetical protein
VKVTLGSAASWQTDGVPPMLAVGSVLIINGVLTSTVPQLPEAIKYSIGAGSTARRGNGS